MARNLDEIAPGISNVEKTLLFFFQDLFKCKEVNYKKAIDTFTATYLYSCKDICAEVQNNPRIGFVTAHYLKHMRRLRKRAFELIRQECELVDKLEDSNLSGNEKSKLEEQIIEIHEKLRDAIKEIYLYRNREFNCGIYNICDLLCQVDEDYDENELIWESIEEQNFDETYQFLDDKCNRLIWIHLGVSNYLIEENQRREKFYFNKHYDVVPDLHSAAVTQKRFQIIKKYRKYVPDTDSHLSDLLLHFDLSEVRRKNDIEKFFIALICIMKSYEYEDDFKEYAYILSDILQEIMFCGEIHKIYIQQKGVDKNVMPEERGSENATTRFSIIFSARNEDVYVLRLDLPHKGEIKFHINMHEIVRDKVLPMAYPMSNEEFAQTIKPIPEGLFGKLFFRLNGQIWFRSKFEQKLAEVEWDRKEEIETIFHERSHMVIDAGIENDNRFIEFTNEFQAYITYFGLRSNNYISFGRDDIDYVNEVKKIRITNKYKSKVIECMKECGDAPIDSKKILWNLLGICGAENLIEKNAFYEMNMFERWKFVDEFVII